MVGQEREQAVQSAEITATEEQVSLTSDESSELLQEELDLDMDSLINETMSSIEQGQVITGTIVKVLPDGVVVDIGSKSEGVIPLSEFQGENDDAELKPGMEVEVMVIRHEGKDGLPILSRRRARERAAKKVVRRAYEKGEAVKCYVKGIVRGGFEVDVDGLRGFIPFSQMGPGARTADDQQALVGQRIEAKILEMRNKRDLILSQRKAIEEKRERLREETLVNLKEGQWVKGVVKNLTDFGAFVDLGGIDGLLHVKDMSWDHVAHPRDIVQVGDEIEVMVLSVEGERISLGLKQKSPDPWLSVHDKYPAGSVVAGKITSLTKYGAFVSLEEGVEGLIHISEMSWTKRVRHPNELLKEGDEVRVKVLSIDEEKKRISLSLRQTSVDPWTLAKTNYPTGTVIEGEVTGLTDFGAFVRLPEGVDGMIHVSDLSWADKAVHPKKVLKKGERVKVKVLEIDPSQQRISLGLKQLEPDPWDQAAQKYRPGTVLNVTVKRVTEFGAFVELEEGIEGLAHSSGLVPKGQSHENAVKVGDVLAMKVTKFDKASRKISLSLREYQREQEEKEVQQFMQAETGGNATLGELLGEQMRALMNKQKAETQKAEAQAIEAQATETQAIESQATEAQETETQEIEAQAIEDQAIESQAIETQEIEDQAIESQAIETQETEGVTDQTHQETEATSPTTQNPPVIPVAEVSAVEQEVETLRAPDEETRLDHEEPMPHSIEGVGEEPLSYTEEVPNDPTPEQEDVQPLADSASNIQGIVDEDFGEGDHAPEVEMQDYVEEQPIESQEEQAITTVDQPESIPDEPISSDDAYELTQQPEAQEEEREQQSQ